jgi:hypothetical protein
VHQELRGLGYRRYVVRTADGRALSSAVYARTTPSHWQFTDAAKRLWGLSSDVHVFDDQGEPVTDTLTPASGSTTIAAPAETRVAQPAFAEGSEEPGVRKAGVGRETPGPSAAQPKTRIDPRQLPELIARANHSLSDADPRKITASLVGDLASAVRTIRLGLQAGSLPPDEATERRALADRLEAHARALGSYLRPRADDARTE